MSVRQNLALLISLLLSKEQMLLFWLQSKRSIRQPGKKLSGSAEVDKLFSGDELPDLPKLDKLLRKPNKELLAKVLRDYYPAASNSASLSPLDQKLLIGILDKPKIDHQTGSQLEQTHLPRHDS